MAPTQTVLVMGGSQLRAGRQELGEVAAALQGVGQGPHPCRQAVSWNAGRPHICWAVEVCGIVFPEHGGLCRGLRRGCWSPTIHTRLAVTEPAGDLPGMLLGICRGCSSASMLCVTVVTVAKHTTSPHSLVCPGAPGISVYQNPLHATLCGVRKISDQIPMLLAQVPVGCSCHAT